ncbi:hypothetical protein V2J09_000485 [Rumex salicifolius]
MADYDNVLTQGPWMLGDNYLTIRKWVPRFNVQDDKISSLVVWVCIPWLNIEYFDRRFVHIIESKIGKVLRVDKQLLRWNRDNLFVSVWKRTLIKEMEPEGRVTMVDIGNDFYVIKSLTCHDGRTRMIGESYLTMQRWRPNFIAAVETIRFITTWIRIPNLSLDLLSTLSMEYFDHGDLT